MNNSKPEFDLDERIAGLKEIAQHGNLWPEAVTELRDFAEEIETFYKPMLAAAPELLSILKDLLVWDDGNLPGDLMDIAQRTILKAEGKG